MNLQVWKVDLFRRCIDPILLAFPADRGRIELLCSEDGGCMELASSEDHSCIEMAFSADHGRSRPAFSACFMAVVSTMIPDSFRGVCKACY